MLAGEAQFTLIVEPLTIGNPLASSLSTLRLEHPNPLPVGGFGWTNGLSIKVEEVA